MLGVVTLLAATAVLAPVGAFVAPRPLTAYQNGAHLMKSKTTSHRMTRRFGLLKVRIVVSSSSLNLYLCDWTKGATLHPRHCRAEDNAASPHCRCYISTSVACLDCLPGGFMLSRSLSQLLLAHTLSFTPFVDSAHRISTLS